MKINITIELDTEDPRSLYKQINGKVLCGLYQYFKFNMNKAALAFGHTAPALWSLAKTAKVHHTLKGMKKQYEEDATIQAALAEIDRLQRLIDSNTSLHDNC